MTEMTQASRDPAEITKASLLNWQDAYRLSRFALLRAGDNGFVLESPLNNRQFPVQGASVIRVLEALSRPVRLEALLSRVEEPERAVLRNFLTTCIEARLLTRVGDDGLTEEERGPLGYWEFHDLLFHASTRFGRNRHPIGGTCRLKDRLPPEPAFEQEERLVSFTLPAPEWVHAELSFTEVLERRRSGYGQQSLTLSDLSAFLYWTCRVTQVRQQDQETLVQKLYPSGGGLHPLRVYAAIRACEGCAPGLYRYMDREHALSMIHKQDEMLNKFFTDANNATGDLGKNSPALFIISARFHRTSWKYESIAYRLVLMEVGVLLQTMYLASTALGLKGCALGCGDSDHFARVAETEYYTETSVGEFLLGA